MNEAETHPVRSLRWWCGVWIGSALLLGLLPGPVVASETAPVEAAPPEAAPPETAPPETARVDTLVDTLVEEMRAIAEVPAISVAILEGTEIVVAKGHGFADLDRKKPVEEQTQYRAASVSKLITATAVARLVDAGKLDLDEPIDTYLARIPGTDGTVSFPGGDVITARQLAGHLSGLGHYQGQDKIARFRAYESVADSLETFRDSPRAGEPGGQYRYSTHGYTLLSAVVEGASGKPFLDYLEEEIFAPLGMTHSGPDRRPDPPETMATLYGRRAGKTFAIPMVENPSYKWAGGGLVTTPSDLLRLARGYYEGFVSKETVEIMFTPQRLPSGEETGVGIGWRIGADDLGRPIRHHAGSMGGARSVLLLFPEEQSAIAVMANMAWSASIERTAVLLYDAFHVDRIATSSRVAHTGRYAFEGIFTVREKDEEHRQDVAGVLTLSAGEGSLEVPPAVLEWMKPEAPASLHFHRLNGDRWALVTPYGLTVLELQPEGEALRLSTELGSGARLVVSARALAEQSVGR